MQPMDNPVLTPDELAYLDRVVALLRDPEISLTAERNILGAVIAAGELRGAQRKQGMIDRMVADMRKIMDAVGSAADHDQLAQAFVQVARNQGGHITGDMVANLIAQLVKTRAELIQLLNGTMQSGKGPTMVFGHYPPAPADMAEAFDAFQRMRGGSGDRGAFEMAVRGLLQREPERPAPESAS